MDTPATGGGDPDGPSLRGASPRAYLDLLRNGSFRDLSLSTLLSALGDWIGFLAIIALVTDILGQTSGAAFAVSGVMVARVVPSLLFGPIAGVLVDRWDRKQVLVVADIGRGVVMALIPFTDEILALVLATLVIEVMSALFAPAKDAVFPRLVRRDELVLANQVNLIVTYATLPLGGVIYAGLVGLAASLAPAGSFVADRPVAVAIWFNALSYFASAPLNARLRIPADVKRPTLDPATAPGAWDQLKEGFAFVATHPVIRSLIVGVMVAFASAGVVISTGEFFATVINADGSGYGILVAVVGAGLAVGLVSSAPLTERVRPERLFAPGIGIAGGALVATAMMPSLVTASLPAFVMGLGSGVSFIVGYTVLQQRSDDRIRGRTFAAFNSGVRTALFAATVAVPAMIGLIGWEQAVQGPGGEPIYPYEFGGVRITLIAAGTLAVAGAVVTGHSLHRALTGPRPADLDFPPSDEGPSAGPRAGVLVTFEGGDGAGKSTQIRLLRSAVERAGHHVLVTREPGGTRLGESVRELLLTPDASDLGSRTEALLYAAARAQHVDEVIRPALAEGAVVLCDRFVDSSIAYQGAGRGLGEPEVAELNRWATGELVPDLVVLLEVEPAEGLRRAGDRHTSDRRGHDRLEAAGEEFHREVAASYHRRAREERERYLVLDGTRPVEATHAEVRDAVIAQLERAGTAELPVREPEPGLDQEPEPGLDQELDQEPDEPTTETARREHR